MTRRVDDTVVATTEPWLVLQQSVPKEGAQEEFRKGRGGPGTTSVVQAGCDHIVGCCHHWIIEAAIGALSKGVCQRCGEEKLFRNQLQWDEIAPVKVMKGRRQENDDTRTQDQREAPAFVLAGSRYGSSTLLQSAGRGY